MANGTSLDLGPDDFANLDPNDPRYAEKLLAAHARAAKKRAAEMEALVRAQQRSGFRPRAFGVPPHPGSARGMLSALAGQADDRTLQQVRAQLAALACDEYEWQPLPPKGRSDLQPERIRTGNAERLIKSLGWLRRCNVLGYDIYVRPKGGRTGLVFFDDLSRDAVERMKADGLSPAAVVESSPANNQGWVRVAAAGELSEQEATACAQYLARRYGGDLGSADWRHYGRLAGFTNKKPKHRQPNGLQPFCVLRGTHAGVTPGGASLVAEARERLAAAERAELQRVQHARNAATFRADEDKLGDAVAAFREARELVESKREGDESRKDFGAALRMHAAGWSFAQIAAAMREASPSIDERHARDLERYVERTVRRAQECQQRQQRRPGYRPRR